MVNSRAKGSDIVVGQKYGRLTTKQQIILFKSNRNRAYWICKCDCGNSKTIDHYHLKNKSSLSCGCLQKERAAQAQHKHGFALTRIHNIWRGMMRRCYDSKAPRYQRYGGRGIIVCESWHNFETFMHDMGMPPLNKSLDRIDNDKNYCKENCRWASRHEQANNTSRNKFIDYAGGKYTIPQLARFLNCSIGKIRYRLSKGMPLHDQWEN